LSPGSRSFTANSGEAARGRDDRIIIDHCPNTLLLVRNWVKMN